MPCVGLTSFLRVETASKMSAVDGVSMPCVGLTSFLQQFWSNNWSNPYLCQCPVSGLPHFYFTVWWWSWLILLTCQCPVSGLPHFYGAWRKRSWSAYSVSMPCVGLTSFLPWNGIRARKLFQVCQCPVSGLPHFYCAIYDQHGAKASECVNALCRAYLISTRPWVLWRNHEGSACQCPVSGLPHFYRRAPYRYRIAVTCQCPVSGLPHFYFKEVYYGKSQKCVSMPSVGLTSFLRWKSCGST